MWTIHRSIHHHRTCGGANSFFLFVYPFHRSFYDVVVVLFGCCGPEDSSDHRKKGIGCVPAPYVRLICQLVSW